MGQVTTMVFTGRNGAEVKAWVNAHPHIDAFETWFLTKGMSASTGGQAWTYARDGRPWPQEVSGALYDATTGVWQPVVAGDLIVRLDDRYEVRDRDDAGP